MKIASFFFMKLLKIFKKILFNIFSILIGIEKNIKKKIYIIKKIEKEIKKKKKMKRIFDHQEHWLFMSGLNGIGNTGFMFSVLESPESTANSTEEVINALKLVQKRYPILRSRAFMGEDSKLYWMECDCDDLMNHIHYQDVELDELTLKKISNCKESIDRREEIDLLLEFANSQVENLLTEKIPQKMATNDLNDRTGALFLMRRVISPTKKYQKKKF